MLRSKSPSHPKNLHTPLPTRRKPRPIKQTTHRVIMTTQDVAPTLSNTPTYLTTRPCATSGTHRLQRYGHLVGSLDPAYPY